MEGKKSFLLYCDQIGLFEQLPDAQAGKLIKLIFAYVNDQNPEIEDLLLKVAFEPIKLQLKRDLTTWNNIVERNRINGAKGGRPKNPKKAKKPSGIIGKPKEPKKAVNDNDTDSDTVNDNVIVTVNDNNSKELPNGSLHVVLIGIYSKWFNNKFQMKPQIDGGDGKGLKEIIKFLRANCKDEGETVDLWTTILNSYDKWEKFHQGQTRLKQINSNLQNIITHVRKNAPETEEDINRAIRDYDSNIAGG